MAWAKNRSCEEQVGYWLVHFKWLRQCPPAILPSAVASFVEHEVQAIYPRNGESAAQTCLRQVRKFHAMSQALDSLKGWELDSLLNAVLYQQRLALEHYRGIENVRHANVPGHRSTVNVRDQGAARRNARIQNEVRIAKATH